MVAPIRDLANTLNPAASKETTINPMVQDNSNMDMDIDTPEKGLLLLALTVLEHYQHTQICLLSPTMREWKSKATN